MQKSCLQCGVNFEITDADLAFYKKVSPSFNRPAERGGFKQMYDIPPPKLCPDCRQQRRLAFRNERKLYKRKCDLCQKEIISMYYAQSSFPVYCPQCWWSDKWDGTQFGREFAFSRSFFEQFAEIVSVVPKMSLSLQNNNINCDYTNLNGFSKNCYLIFASTANDNCLYTTYLQRNYFIVDCLFIFDSQYCYECIDCYNCYELTYSQYCHNCSESSFLYDCRNCNHCFGCVSLVNKQYYLFNQPYSKEEYFLKVKEILVAKNFFKSVQKKKFDLQVKMPQKYYAGFQNENVTGDHISFSHNVSACFDSTYLEDSKFCIWMHQTKDCYDCYAWGSTGELGYELQLCGYNFYDIQFCNFCSNDIRELRYCYHCFNCNQNLFGCVGLKHKQYCILNKQYTKEAYEELTPRIIEHMQKAGEWGEFFPVEISPFAYNETVAQEYFPLTKEEVLRTRSKWWNVESPPVKGDLGGLKPQGDDNFQIKSNGATPLNRGEQLAHWRWRDEEDKIPDVKKIIPAEKLPDAIQDIPDDILNWAIRCEKSGKLFRIQKAELDFYRKMDLPIPHFHPDIRHQMRMAKRNPRKLWRRNCAECKIEIETTYSPDRPEKVLCEECYLKEIN